jgi:AbrB family looped-hinge helix DNA binding protein
MLERTVTLDKQGRLALPTDVRDALGVGPDSRLTMRVVDKKLILEATPEIGPITSRIARMDLPVSDWDTMQRQIEQGRLA